ncbi:MAG: hypothetical protein ABJN40_05510 [Sneathiella sp.]
MSLISNIENLATAIRDKFNSLLSVHDKGNVSGAVAVDYADGSVQKLTVTADITTLTISNWPAAGSKGQLVLYLDLSADRACTFSGVTGWATGSAPALKSGLNELVFTTIDGGTKVIGHAVALGI